MIPFDDSTPDAPGPSYEPTPAMTDPDHHSMTDIGRSPRSGRPMTRRQKRRRMWLLIILAILLLLLSYVGYQWFRTRQLPTLGLRGPLGIESIAPPTYLYSITGEGANHLTRPVGVATANGRVYVADFDTPRISVFTERGSFLFAFQEIGGEVLSRPHVVAINNDEVWVTDRGLRGLYVFDLDGTFVREFEPEEEALAKWAPFAIDFASDGRFIVTDVSNRNNHKVHFFSADGELTVTVGREVPPQDRFREPGAFFFPASVAIAENDRVYISDGDNRRLQVFDMDGEFVANVNSSGVPRGSDTDGEGRLYVADGLAHTVDVYDLAGKRLTQFGGKGFGPGQFSYPGYVAVNSANRIFISDRENDQVQVWGWAATPPVPEVLKPRTPLGWLLCLSPLALLPFLWLLRKRRVVVTPDFVEALIDEALVTRVSDNRRLRLICPIDDHVFYAGRTADGIDLGSLIEPEEHSASDANALKERYEISERESILLSMGSRVAALATQDLELRRLATLIEVQVVDVDEFTERFLSQRSSRK